MTFLELFPTCFVIAFAGLNLLLSQCCKILKILTLFSWAVRCKNLANCDCGSPQVNTSKSVNVLLRLLFVLVLEKPLRGTVELSCTFPAVFGK